SDAAGYSSELLGILRTEAEQGDVYIAEGPDAGDAAAAADAPIVVRGDAAMGEFVVARFESRAVALLLPTSADGHGETSALVTRAMAALVSPRPTSFDPAGGDAGARDAMAGDATSAANDAATPQPIANAHRLAVFDTGGTVAGVRSALDSAERDGA